MSDAKQSVYVVPNGSPKRSSVNVFLVAHSLLDQNTKKKRGTEHSLSVTTTLDKKPTLEALNKFCF
jgi:hypothetical protein